MNMPSDKGMVQISHNLQMRGCCITLGIWIDELHVKR